MKTLTRTMSVFVAVHLITVSLVLAGNVANEENADTADIRVKQADLAKKQAELVQKRAELVQDKARYGTRITVPSISTSRNVLLGSRFGGTSSVLVIPSAEITTEDIATITEDMNIMSRIFEKNLQQAHIDVDSMFFSRSDPFHIAFSRGKESTQSMYLQGYGALFLMKVDFPLSPGPQVEEEQETQQQKEGDVDPVWEEIQREMYEPEKYKKNKSEQPKKEYDAEKVENLKTTLIKALKHAANIRNLKPDEQVILTISGNSTSSGIKSMRRIPETGQVIVIDDNNNTSIIQGGLPENIGLSVPTVIVIRAKKSDIDRFKKGEIDLDQFQQNIQILTSAYLANPSGSGNPFTGYYFNNMTNR